MSKLFLYSGDNPLKVYNFLDKIPQTKHSVVLDHVKELMEKYQRKMDHDKKVYNKWYINYPERFKEIKDNNLLKTIRDC